MTKVDRELLRTLCELAQDGAEIDTRNLIDYATPARILALLDRIEPADALRATKKESGEAALSKTGDDEVTEARKWMAARGYGNQSLSGALADLQSRINAKDEKLRALSVPSVAQSIDTPEFWELVNDYAGIDMDEEGMTEGMRLLNEARDAIISYLAAQAAPATPAPVAPQAVQAQVLQDEFHPDFLRRNKWTLLLTGDNAGLAGPFGSKFDGSPVHYDRVDVIAIDAFTAPSSTEARATAPEVRDAARFRKVVSLIGFAETGTAEGPVWTLDLPRPSRFGNTDENFVAAIDAALRTTTPSQAPASGTEGALTCSTCGADRSKERCKAEHWQKCPMVGTATGTAANQGEQQ